MCNEMKGNEAGRACGNYKGEEKEFWWEDL
jgi:hypothetical protein